LNKKKIFLWAADYSNESGEGNLARKFVKKILKREKFTIVSLGKKNTFNHKYISPFFGIFHCWKNYLKGNRVGYLNYLPLWNFFIFLFLPPKSIIGPITGGAKFNKIDKLNYLMRKFIFPILYYLSNIIINLRFEKTLFSTDLLKNYLSKEIKRKSKFNFVLQDFKYCKKVKKNIDFLIYYRLHKNKVSFFNTDLISELVKSKYRIYIVGDKLNMKGVKNLGYIKNKRLKKLQAISRFTICSEENVYSLFILECISNHVKVLVDKKSTKKIKLFKGKFLFFDFSKLQNMKKKIKKR
tara:strand:- start:1064 stop:1951 length:888 start_codon:yes stop_codon:yes gene_type:complete